MRRLERILHRQSEFTGRVENDIVDGVQIAARPDRVQYEFLADGASLDGGCLSLVYGPGEVLPSS